MIEMEDGGLSFSREQEMPVFYNQRQIGTRRVDFLVEDVIAVEIKAIIKLEDVHLAQPKTSIFISNRQNHWRNTYIY